MKALRRIFILLVVSGIAAAWFLSRPTALSDNWGAGLEPDAEAGAMVFAAGGCASCHVAPEAKVTPQPVLTGGKGFVSDFGTFYAPNISPDHTHGIGGWSLEQFAQALTLGVSPDGEHYYPAFPYTSYTLMEPQDVVDLYEFLQSLPASDTASLEHDVSFPFSLRRGIGLWKAMYLPTSLTTEADASPLEQRGRYLAEALGHCAECHTPRNAIGGLDRTLWMTGAPDPSGTGKIPGITRSQLDWSEGDLVEYFTSGFTPEYDSAGGDMADVVKNLSTLPTEDRQALAAYVVALP